ncbi:MAG: hypothetical protein ACLVB1_02255 [Blautia obeum]
MESEPDIYAGGLADSVEKYDKIILWEIPHSNASQYSEASNAVLTV